MAISRTIRISSFSAAGFMAAMLFSPLHSPAIANPTAREAPPRMPFMDIALTFVRSTPAQSRKHPQRRALLASGAKIFAAPRLRTLSDTPAEMRLSQQIPYLVGKDGNTKTTSYETGLHFRLLPHLNPDTSIQLSFDADNSEPTSKPGNPLSVAKYGVFNITQTKPGQEIVVGTWKQQYEVVTVFATVTLPDARDAAIQPEEKRVP